MSRTRKRTRPKDPPAPADAQPQRACRRTRRWRLAAVAVVIVGVGALWAAARDRPPPVLSYEVVRSFPHDPAAYTQGLIFADGHFYEGTGKYGESSLRKVEVETGRVIHSHSLTRDLFGEGIAVWDDQVVQLTWRNHIGIVYDKGTFREIRRFRYAGEGWGLTTDGKYLILSDGSATLRFLDPKTNREVRQLLVKSQGRRVANLNELEYVNGEILANIWYKDEIARISPRTGEVTGWIDLTGLWPGRRDTEAVLNGIAYDVEGNRLFVTGKNWPRVYEIRLAGQ